MKEELTELLQKGRAVEKEFIAALSDQERGASGSLEHWTAKDTLAHNAYWRKHHAEQLLTYTDGTYLNAKLKAPGKLLQL